MGATKGRYCEEFPVGSTVKIVDEDALRKFSLEWTFHHPLQEEQLNYASHVAVIKTVFFYHGGDEIYELEGIPGVWHGACLGLEKNC